MQSLYGACQKVTEDGISEIQNVGGYDIYFERFTQNNLENSYSLGNTDQSNVVLLTDSVIQVPSGETLTVASPKKSLVIMCDTLINNGTITMTAKGPDVLPHDYLLLGEDDGFNDILIPAYANNGVERYYTSHNGKDGNNGVNRQCGSGGTGCHGGGGSMTVGASGSGTAFAGGGGGQGLDIYNQGNISDVNTTYPMRGCNGSGGTWGSGGGVGNPAGSYSGGSHCSWANYIDQNFGVGGRIVIFCNKFENNGVISSNGSDAFRQWTASDSRQANYGGASGAGAIDIFYNKLIEEGTITATGGNTFTYYYTPGKGGDGSITLTPMNLPSMVRPGFLGTKGTTRLVELIKDKFEEVEDKIQDATGQVTFDYQNTNTIELAKDEDTKVITANTKISQENENGLYALDDGLYVKFTSFTDEEINLIYNQIQSVSYNTNFTTHDLFAILTRDGYVFKAKE